MREITTQAAIEQIGPVTDFINGILEEIGCGGQARIQVNVAVDELFGNIARYAYTSGSGQVTVRVEAVENPRSVRITFIDEGFPFNPLTRKPPDTLKLSVRERPIGGLGIYMVRKTMDGMTYEYREEKNILTIRKEF